MVRVRLPEVDEPPASTAGGAVLTLGPALYAKQRAAIFSRKRFALCEASTKSGKTTGCLLWLLWQALRHGRPGRAFWWVAPVYLQASVAYGRLRRALESSPVGRDFHYNDTAKTIGCPNGAILVFRSAEKPDNLYAEDVWAAVLDEATRMREDSWHAVRSTLTFTRGPLRIIGNVKGRKNWCYRLARKAEAGAPDWHYAKLTSDDAIDAGVLDRAEVESARQMLPEAVFRELYYTEASDDEGNPFGLEHIRACIMAAGQPVNPVVCWGWDIASKADWTVGIGLDAQGRVAALERFQLPWGETKDRMRRHTAGLPALVDDGGVGDVVVEDLQRELATPGRRANFEGYKFGGGGKQALMERLAVGLQEHRLGLPGTGPLVPELEAFEYEYTRTGVLYSAPEGMHDDCVCALALAYLRLISMPASVEDVRVVSLTQAAPFRIG